MTFVWSATGYALANPGSEYLVLEPHGDGRAFTVDLPAGSYQVEWFEVTSRETSTDEPRVVEQTDAIEFAAPFASGPAVLYLNRVDSGSEESGIG